MNKEKLIVYIDPHMAQWLATEAEYRFVSMSSLVREALAMHSQFWGTPGPEAAAGLLHGQSDVLPNPESPHNGA